MGPGSPQAIVLPYDTVCTRVTHDTIRFLTVRSVVSIARPPVDITHKTGAARETARTGVLLERYEAKDIQLFVRGIDGEARILAVIAALAGRGKGTELAELVHRVWGATVGSRTIALNRTQTDGETVAYTVASALRPSDELFTVITDRNAGRDVGALAVSAAVGARGYVVGEGVEVVVHVSGQECPDILTAIE